MSNNNKNSLSSQQPGKEGVGSLSAVRHRPAMVLLMGLITLALVAATAGRIHDNYSQPSTEFDWSKRGFSDFHNGAYFPAKAFGDGACPYSSETADKYSMARAAPPYSPIVFVLHLPFAMLPLAVARVLFFIFNVVLLFLIAWCSIAMSGAKVRWFDLLGITNLLLVSRPGHITLFTGYFTAEIVIGCILALHFAKTRPIISGLGMVLASIKPNFIIPLVIMMLFRRNFRAVTAGILFCAIAAGTGLGWLCINNGVQQTISDIRSGQEELHIDPNELPVNTWTRVDVLGMIAKVINWAPDDKIYLLGMSVFLTLTGFVVYRAAPFESNSGATGLTAFIAILSILLGLYHHAYDILLIAVPAIGVLFFGKQTLAEVPDFWRKAVAILVTIPAINYLSTKSLMDLLGLEPLSFTWQAVTLINGICLLGALVILLTFAATLSRKTHSS